jgi:hypothetical protein
MALPPSLMPQNRGLRKKRTFIDYKDLETGEIMITLNFSEGHNMLIEFEGRRYRPVSAYFQIQAHGTQGYLNAPIELNDARLEDAFQVSRHYIDRFIPSVFEFEWTFRMPLTIQGHTNVVGIFVLLPPGNAASEQSFIMAAARRGSRRDDADYYFH